MLTTFLFIRLVMSLASSVYKGEGKYYRGRYISLKDMRSKINVYDPDAKDEYNEDHTKKNVIMDNEAFDMFFRPDERKQDENEHVLTEEELKTKQKMKEFEDEKNTYLVFLRRKYGIKR
ncbi:hypothetical protein THOM_0326 [Trachipleistophora hominis]|uniref:Uncharacterized protein n=1 Tax=Trachipleistophora hominis TaxID=72359 RepID=L7JZ58_TRAHO|nr:hypothetical protein THOM_0326 [Trachipleistophora hominis]